MHPARVLNLRSEFEAQLRAVARLEEQFRKTDGANDERWRRLDQLPRRELTEKLANNANVRSVPQRSR
jgi:hypothetical protein